MPFLETNRKAFTAISDGSLNSTVWQTYYQWNCTFGTDECKVEKYLATSKSLNKLCIATNLFDWTPPFLHWYSFAYSSCCATTEACLVQFCVYLLQVFCLREPRQFYCLRVLFA